MERPELAGVHHLGLSVTDLDRSIRFYRDVLGAALIREPYTGDSPSFSGRMAIVALGRHGFDLFEHTSNKGQRFDPTHTGLDHLGLVAQSQEELQGWADWLDTCEVSHSPIRDSWGGAMFDFTDPDGIQFEFFWRDLAKGG